MFTRVIVSQSEGTYFDVEAVFVGDDENEVIAQANVKFREIIKAKEETKTDPMDDDEIEEAVSEGSYYADLNKPDYEAHVFTTNQLVVLKSQKEFDVA